MAQHVLGKISSLFHIRNNKKNQKENEYFILL